MIRTAFADIAEITRENEPMAFHTSFGVGGPVACFVEPRTWDELALACERSERVGLPVRVLGRGSNTLVTDGPHPWVVLSTRRLDDVRRDGRRVEAGAGLALSRLVALAETWGLGGLEVLAGIPGSVGGAVAMNAGGRHGCVANSLVGAMVVAPGQMPRWADAAELGLDYRYSIIPKTRMVLLSATFDLDKALPRDLRERRLSIVASKNATQPMDALSAGCVFKNPNVAPGAAPADTDDPRLKGAGWLIDHAGLKGTRVGGAAVSTKHANFIVNEGHASARDILGLIQIVLQRVHQAFRVRLELEIEIWGEQED